MYNVEKHIKKTIESILANTYGDFELLLIDDGSTDRTVSLASEYTDPRIRIYEKENGGVSSARNYGISLANGEYLCFIDGDDYVEKTYFEELYQYIDTKQLDWVVCNYAKARESIHSYINSIGAYYDNVAYYGDDIKDHVYGRLFFGNWGENLASNCMGIYRTSVIKENGLRLKEKLIYGEDIEFNYHVLKHIKGFGYLCKVLYYYNHDNESSSSKNLDDSATRVVSLISELEETRKAYKDDLSNREVLYACYQLMSVFRYTIYPLNKALRKENYGKFNQILDGNTNVKDVIACMSYEKAIHLVDAVYMYIIKNRNYEFGYKLWKIRHLFD